MIYQLPNGRIVYLTIEQYLEMSDADFQNLNTGEFGDYATSHWDGSSVNDKRSERITRENELDYDSEDDEPPCSHKTITSITIITLDDSFPHDVNNLSEED